MTRLDWIAVGPRGVYALMDAGLADAELTPRLRDEAVRLAVRRHRDALERSFVAAAAAGIGMPADLPSPAQLDLFGGRP